MGHRPGVPGTLGRSGVSQKLYVLSLMCLSRGRELNRNFFFFSNFSGTPGVTPQNPGISRQKSLISLVSRDIPNFLAPTPSRWKTPTPPENIWTPKFGCLCSFFLCAFLLSILDSQSRDPKTSFALSLSAFGHVCFFDTCTGPACSRA